MTILDIIILRVIKKKYNYKYDQKKVLSTFDKVRISNQAVLNDLKRSIDFVNQAFNDFNNSAQVDDVKFAFLIPMRVSRHSHEYWEDIIEFIPVLKYLSLSDAYEVMISLPPCKIEFYGPKAKQSTGVVIMAPVFGDMVQDYKSKLLLVRKMRNKIQDTVNFAHNKFKADYIGLGGMLPKITNYGQSIKKPPGLTITTGHAGTVSLILMLFEDVVRDKVSEDLVIGVLGGGSIGSATLQAITTRYPSYKYYIYDKRGDVNQKNKELLLEKSAQVHIAKNNKELLDNSDIIISAITKKIDIEDVDLTNKIIIDDSQPGSFDKDNIERLGGKLIWVVGHDSNDEQFVVRRNGFSYGPYGLLDNKDVWGCEGEVAMLSYFNKRDAAVVSEVTDLDIKRITILFKKYGISIADHQAFGKKSP